VNDTVLWSVDKRGVATVTLNRPQVNNAYNGDLIAGLHSAMDALGREAGLRIVVLKGNGRHFQAGADLAWINGVARQSPGENELVSRLTAEAVLMNAPAATTATKLRALASARAFIDDGELRDLIDEHARTRQQAEATEGLASFKEKRKPSWYPG
jgi:enoyl-CoA hydratase/carnithine racemase